MSCCGSGLGNAYPHLFLRLGRDSDGRRDGMVQKDLVHSEVRAVDVCLKHSYGDAAEKVENVLPFSVLGHCSELQNKCIGAVSVCCQI